MWSTLKFQICYQHFGIVIGILVSNTHIACSVSQFLMNAFTLIYKGFERIHGGSPCITISTLLYHPFGQIYHSRSMELYIVRCTFVCQGDRAISCTRTCWVLEYNRLVGCIPTHISNVVSPSVGRRCCCEEIIALRWIL